MAGYSGFKTDIQGTVVKIPWGNAGVFASADKLVSFIRTYRKDPDVISFARRLVRHCPSKDYRCEARTIFRFVQNNIRFVRDPYHVESIQSPDVTLSLERSGRSGDCDDHVVLLGSLLEAIGIPVRVVLIASRSASPGRYNHVFVEALLPVNKTQKWIAMDTTPIDMAGKLAKFGWLPPGYTYKRITIE